MEDDWNNDKASQAMIKRGIKLGAALFTKVYTDFAHTISLA